MDRFARVVLGYHGCEPDFAEGLIRGDVPISDWRPSQNPFDWLGHGIYFWEYAPERARDWRGKRGVVGAILQLGECLDLCDTSFAELLRREYTLVRAKVRQAEGSLPRNRGKRRDLDCLIINSFIDSARESGVSFQTVRSPFLEGRPVFPGSRILRESHIQVTVRDLKVHFGRVSPSLRITGMQ